MGHRLVLADVFTDAAFAGNPLAVCPEPAAALDAAAMQAVAAEIGFSETTFVAAPAAEGWGVRIFTPSVELPFAGHPSVGTAAVLVHLGMAPEGRVTLQEGVGPVSVEVRRAAPGRLHAELSIAPTLRRSPAPPVHDVAAALGVDVGEVLDVAVAGVGLDFVLVRLRDPDVLGRLVPSAAGIAALPASAYVVAVDGDHAGARMWSGRLGPGVEEDPGTGSAAAALVAEAAARTGRDVALTIDQGVAMGRPCRIEAAARVVDGAVAEVRVGGGVVVVAEGELLVP